MSAKKITKVDLLNSIAVLGVKRASAAAIVEVFLTRLKDELLAGNVVELRGFCTIKTQARKSRTIRNVLTGELGQALGGQYLKIVTHQSFKAELEKPREDS